MEKLSRYYHLLGIQPGATKNEIYQAYVEAEKSFHEERFADDPAVRRRAQEKLKRINEAYLALMDSYGEVEELLEDFGYADVPDSAPSAGSAPEQQPPSKGRSDAPAADSFPAAERRGDTGRGTHPEGPEVPPVRDHAVVDNDEAGTNHPIPLRSKETRILFSVLAILVLVALIFVFRQLGKQPVPVRTAASTTPAKTAVPTKAPAAGTVPAKESPVKRGTIAPHPVQRSEIENLPDEALVRHDAALGRPKAQTQLGYRYLVGKGVTKDVGQAAVWFRKAADQGDAEAQDWLGYLYETGTGVNKNPVEAARWYRLAAEQGNADAQKNLGLMYRRGKGIEKNVLEGMRWLRKAAAQGDREAQRALDIWEE